MKEAAYYTKKDKNKVQCILCPHLCIIAPEKYGNCKSRSNKDGILFAETYGKVAAMNFDPIEKKPLYHFHPGSSIFSIGSTGCNMHCVFCQNCTISQADPFDFTGYRNISPEQILEIMKQRPDSLGIAYTYNEPSIWFEYMFEIASLVNSFGYKNVAVTNGFINKDPLKQLLGVIDAFNVDLKSFSNEFYKVNCKAQLDTVKNTLLSIRENGKHLEITNLIIPTLNDLQADFEKMCRWICNELGKETVLHLSRYFPMYQLTIERTPLSTIEELYSIATSYLRFVYIGNCNIGYGSDTLCMNCGEKLIVREGYNIRMVGILDNLSCSSCGADLASMGIIVD